MDFGDFMGLTAVLLAMLAAFAILAQMYQRRLAFLERKLEITAGATAEKAARYATDNTELENRVRVLERIITDAGASRDIALQIEALREPGHHSERVPSRAPERIEVTKQ
jgi:hypothetical protein